MELPSAPLASVVPAVPARLLGAAWSPVPGLGRVVDWEKQLAVALPVALLGRQCWVHRDQSKERWEQVQLLVGTGRDLVALPHATCKWSGKKNIPKSPGTLFRNRTYSNRCFK